MKTECPVRSHAVRSGDAIAIRTFEKTLSYSQLDLAVTSLADTLQADLVAGSRAAILAANSLDYVVLLWAMFRVGVIATPLNPRQSAATLVAQVQQAGASIVFHDDEYSRPAQNLGVRAIPLTKRLQSVAPGNVHSSPKPELDSEQLCTICFTSGSGGTPKGVRLSFGNHYYSAIGSNENIRVAPGDCWHLALPLCHVGGLGILFRSFIAGAAVFVDAKFDAQRTTERIDHNELTHLSLVPTMLHDLIIARGDRAFPASLKAVLLGGAAVPSSLLQRAVALKTPVVTSYGMTETASQVTATRPGDPVGRTGTSGIVLNYRRLRIVDETGQTLPVGTAGTIEVGGEVLFRGYTGRPGSSPAHDDWFATGDVGYLDDEGYLTIVGRRDRMFVSGGENIHPEEIERAVLDYPGVSGAVCIAVSDERWGQRPLLVIETKVDDPEFVGDLRSFLSKRLARMMLPDRIILIQDLPRTILGKIDFTQLQQIVGTLDGGQSG